MDAVSASLLTTSLYGIRFIELMEGREHAAYLDERGNWTIGVGHRLPKDSAGITWTQDQIENQLHADLAVAEAGINGVGAVLEQPQFDALVSLAFNIGAHAFENSTVARELKRGRYDRAAEAIELWDDHGRATKRRRLERGVFLYGTKP